MMNGQGAGRLHSQPRGGANGLRFERALAWSCALVPALLLFMLLLRRVWDVDIFWQLKLGELILARHGPVPREPFAALHLGEPLPAVAWAGQAIMAGVRLIGGWGLLRVFDALCWLGGFWAVAWACRKRGASASAVALALILVFCAALPTASIRPQSFACLCFGLLLALQRLGLRPAVTVALGAPLLVVWQNLHPSESIGALAMGVTACAGWLAWLFDRRRAKPIAATILAPLGLIALFATPDGFSIIEVSALNAEVSLAIGASEWLPIWIAGNHANAVPVAAVVLISAILLLRGRRVDPGEIALALVLLVMTACAYRFVLFWSVAMVPVIARAASNPRQAVPNPMPNWATPLAVVAVAVIAPLVFPTRFAETLPLAALERLKQENLRGTVYGDFPFGGALIDVGYPRWRVAYDGRYYRYGRDEWRYNGGIENGLVPLVDVVRKWRPVAFVLDARHNAPIAAELAKSPKWRRIWYRGGIVVYVPRRSWN